jgi:hypothetical protein
MQIFGVEIPVPRGPRTHKLIIAVCFVLGLIVFFPIGSLETRLNDTLSKALAGDVRVMYPSLGFGFRSGFISGGLFGLKAKEIEITLLQAPQPVTCYEAVMSPKLLALLILRLQIAVRCDFGEERSPVLAVARAPLYNLSDLSLDLEIDKLPISEAASLARISGMDGRVSGQLKVSHFTTGFASARLKWDIRIHDLRTPALNTDFGSLPPMNFTQVTTEGSWANRKLLLKPFKMGVDGKDSLVTDLEIELSFNPNGTPSNGYIQGNLKSSSDFDRSIASLVKMDQVFGLAKSNGYRRFKKTIQGNILSLLGPPEELP